MQSEPTELSYQEQFYSRFVSALRWPQFDALIESLVGAADGQWYVYVPGEAVPDEPLSAADFVRFIQEVSDLLRAEHEEEYCGIVYADSLEAPTMVKIYDPNNLGVTCGYSDNPPLPGWVLSRQAPVELERSVKPPANRRRWWNRIFSS